ncbi:MAG: hypothetical protein JST00_24220 [Deltaproteobacteria bacterium]|nr:hypothetical protein [Deltaproteobacteria bacterium]
MSLGPRLVTLASVCILAMSCSVRQAFAQPASASSPSGEASRSPSTKTAAAEELFAEGRRLLTEGNLELACEKLAQSHRLDPSAGTLLNLADCFERRGLVARAWLSFREAARMATDRKRPDWVRLAERRAEALAPQVPHLRVELEGHVGWARPAGYTLSLDGEPLDAELAALRVPVDPGRHEIVASAPGFKPKSVAVVVERGPETYVLRVGPLERVDSGVPGAPASTEPTTPVAGSSDAGGIRAGWFVGAVGIAGVAVGAVTGLLASAALSDAKDACPTYPTLTTSCLPSAETSNERASTLATVSTVSLIAGLALVAVGVTLLVVTPGDRRPVGSKRSPFGAGLRFTF